MMGSFSHAMGLQNGYKLHYDYPLGEKKLLLGTNPPFYISKHALFAMLSKKLLIIIEQYDALRHSGDYNTHR